ncbi:MAG: hypothetical protein WCD37_17410 [Chloroflexia bacterium]
MKTTLVRAGSAMHAGAVSKAVKCGFLAFIIGATTLLGSVVLPSQGQTGGMGTSVAYANDCEGVNPPPNLDCMDPTPTPTPDPDN